ncbi:MAG: ribonuclease HII [Zestosphaera sp.]
MLKSAKHVILGIDEAGRGPVLGDMFVACVGLREEAMERLRGLGVRDSKSLTPHARATLFTKILEVVDIVFVKRYTPSVIDQSNLNELFINAVISSIKTISSTGIQVREVYVDALSSPKHRKKLLGNIPPNIKLVYEYKADVKYPVVAAASIIAKFLRDTHVNYLHSIYGDFGSGYPSDPQTIKWLTEHSPAEVPIIRKTWLTLKKLGFKDTKGKRTRATIMDGFELKKKRL